MAESLLEGKDERAELNKLKLKRDFFEKVEDFVKKSTFFAKMLKFNGNCITRPNGTFITSFVYVCDVIMTSLSCRKSVLVVVSD